MEPAKRLDLSSPFLSDLICLLVLSSSHRWWPPNLLSVIHTAPLNARSLLTQQCDLVSHWHLKCIYPNRAPDLPLKPALLIVIPLSGSLGNYNEQARHSGTIFQSFLSCLILNLSVIPVKIYPGSHASDHLPGDLFPAGTCTSHLDYCISFISGHYFPP